MDHKGKIMHKSITMRVGAVGAASAMAGGLAVIASGTTGAYFSDTKTGSITGTIGNVHLSTTDTTFAWTDMMPGEAKSATVAFTGKGSGPQDFYLVFPNLTALSALNSLGEYGAVHISGNAMDNWDSANLNDGYPCGTPGNVGVATLCSVPQQLKLASNLGINETRNFTFQFN